MFQNLQLQRQKFLEEIFKRNGPSFCQPACVMVNSILYSFYEDKAEGMTNFRVDSST